MATDAGELVVTLRADIKNLSDQLKTAGNSVNQFGVGTVAIGTALGLSITSVAKKIADFGLSAVKSFGEQEMAMARLSNLVGKDLANSFLEYAEQLQQTTTFSNESILALQTQLASFGVMPGSINQVTRALVDYAAATGKDLPEAGAMMAQAMAGQGRELKRYGLELSAVASRTENMEKTTKFLEERFQGSAETIKNTTLGQYQNLINRIDDLKKKLGEELMPVIATWTGWLQKGVAWVEKLTGAQKNNLSVDQLALQQLRERLKTAQDPGEQQMLVKLIRATQDRMLADKKATEEKKKNTKVATGATETEIDAIRRLKDQLLSQEQIYKHIGEIAKLSTDLKISQAQIELSKMQADQTRMTEIIDLETQKRLQTSAMSYEANASFSDQLKVKMTEDMNGSTAQWVAMVSTMIDSFAQSTAKMIMEGGRFADVLKNLWKQIAEAVIAQIVRMIAQYMVWMAISGGGGGGFMRGFMAGGGMINEPSVITGLRTGKQHIAGEAGPEMVVPTSGRSGGGNFAFGSGGAPALAGAGGSGGNITINITGSFLEGNASKWQKLVKEAIVPEVRRWSMGSPVGPFNRRRGSAGV